MSLVCFAQISQLITTEKGKRGLVPIYAIIPRAYANGKNPKHNVINLTITKIRKHFFLQNIIFNFAVEAQTQLYSAAKTLRQVEAYKIGFVPCRIIA